MVVMIIVLLQHNMYYPLDLPKKRKHQILTSMIKGLGESPLMHAITSNPKIHSCSIEDFWTKAKAVKDGKVITTEVAGKNMRIKEV